MVDSTALNAAASAATVNTAAADANVVAGKAASAADAAAAAVPVVIYLSSSADISAWASATYKKKATDAVVVAVKSFIVSSTANVSCVITASYKTRRRLLSGSVVAASITGFGNKADRDLVAALGPTVKSAIGAGVSSATGATVSAASTDTAAATVVVPFFIVTSNPPSFWNATLKALAAASVSKSLLAAVSDQGSSLSTSIVSVAGVSLSDRPSASSLAASNTSGFTNAKDLALVQAADQALLASIAKGLTDLGIGFTDVAVYASVPQSSSSPSDNLLWVCAAVIVPVFVVVAVALLVWHLRSKWASHHQHAGVAVNPARESIYKPETHKAIDIRPGPPAGPEPSVIARAPEPPPAVAYNVPAAFLDPPPLLAPAPFRPSGALRLPPLSHSAAFPGPPAVAAPGASPGGGHDVGSFLVHEPAEISMPFVDLVSLSASPQEPHVPRTSEAPLPGAPVPRLSAYALGPIALPAIEHAGGPSTDTDPQRLHPEAHLPGPPVPRLSAYALGPIAPPTIERDVEPATETDPQRLHAEGTALEQPVDDPARTARRLQSIDLSISDPELSALRRLQSIDLSVPDPEPSARRPSIDLEFSEPSAPAPVSSLDATGLVPPPLAPVVPPLASVTELGPGNDASEPAGPLPASEPTLEPGPSETSHAFTRLRRMDL